MRLPALYVPDVGPALCGAIRFPRALSPALIAYAVNMEDGA